MSENEILVWLLGTVVLGFLVLYRRDIRRLPGSDYLMAAYVAAWVAWLATNLEHLFFYTAFNVLEHTGYALNGVLLLIGCGKWLSSGAHETHAHD